MTYDVVCADVLEWAAGYEGEPFHAMLCDPPYEMGFMNKAFDKTGISFRPETWAALAEHLLPGGFIMAFSGARTYHRMAVAMEDAGLIMHPSIFGWAYGCLSEDTEILTSRGWESYRASLTGSMVMCYNVNTGTFAFMPVQETFEYEINDTAYRIQSDSTDQIVTRDHRCLVERGGKLTFKKATSLECQEKVPILESVPSLPSAVCRGELRPVSQEEPLLTEMCDRDIPSKAQWKDTWTAQRQERLLPETQAQGESNHLSRLWEGEIQNCRLFAESESSYLLKKLQRGTAGRRLCCARIQGTCCLDGRSRTQLQAKDERSEQSRLEGWSNVLSQKGQLRTVQYQVCAVPKHVSEHGPKGWICNGTPSFGSSGVRSTISAERGGSSHRSQPGEQQPEQFCIVCQQQPTQKVRGDWKTRTTLATVTPTYYKGKVWCVRVPTGAFVARRNGHVFITGNSGFPKATRIDTQIDKAAGAEREVVGQRVYGDGHIQRSSPDKLVPPIGTFKRSQDDRNIEIPATDLAAQWAGHRYGLQAMKPAVEPILLFQKPWEGKRLDCIVETGAGALNIEQSRIGTEDTVGASGRWGFKSERGWNENSVPSETQITYEHNNGRWPANFVLCHVSPDADGNGGCVRDGVRRVKGERIGSRGAGGQHGKYSPIGGQDGHDYADADGRETVANWVCVEECPVRRLGEQSGEQGSAKAAYRTTPANRAETYSGFDGCDGRTYALNTYGDKGTAARFFHNSDWSYEVAERLAGADAVRYCAKSGRKERDAGLDGKRSNHPTVKPIKLTQWLATLLLPPDAYAPRRILVPFSGSGSEAIGAMLAGWEHITLVEMDSDYCDIANARLAWWTEQADGQMWPDVKEILKNAK